MKKDKVFLGIGAVFIILLLIVNTAFAGLATTYKTEENDLNDALTTVEEETYVDSNIYLTRNHLPILRRSVLNIEDEEIKDVTEKIINTIEETGYVDSEKVKDILQSSNMNINGLHMLCRISTSKDRFFFPMESGGNAIPMPGILRSMLFGFFSKGGILTWNACDYSSRKAHVIVGRESYNSDHNGLALGYVGFVSNWNAQCTKNYLVPVFNLQGFALLVFVY